MIFQKRSERCFQRKLPFSVDRNLVAFVVFGFLRTGLGIDLLFSFAELKVFSSQGQCQELFNAKKKVHTNLLMWKIGKENSSDILRNSTILSLHKNLLVRKQIVNGSTQWSFRWHFDCNKGVAFTCLHFPRWKDISLAFCTREQMKYWKRLEIIVRQQTWLSYFMLQVLGILENLNYALREFSLWAIVKSCTFVHKKLLNYPWVENVFWMGFFSVSHL